MRAGQLESANDQQIKLAYEFIYNKYKPQESNHGILYVLRDSTIKEKFICLEYMKRNMTHNAILIEYNYAIDNKIFSLGAQYEEWFQYFTSLKS